MRVEKYIFIISLLCFQVCLSVAQKRTSKTEVEFIQGEKHFLLENTNTEIQLKRDPFSIDFILKKSNEKKGEFYIMRFVAAQEDTYFKYMKEGTSVEETPILANGTSMATNENNSYNSLFLIEGNHNFYYESPKNQRGGAKVIASYPGKKLKLRWYIPDIYEYRQTPYPFTELKGDKIFLIIFMDKDDDKIIDKGEYYKVTLNFDSL